jgi:transposase
MRSKIPELTAALAGRFSSHHRYMAELYLHRIDAHTADIEDLSARIETAIAPFRFARELLVSIPGFSTTTAEVFIAETGADMTVFSTAGHFASWAGASPGSNESAGRVKSTKTRRGNRYLKGALGAAALSAARSKNTCFSAQYRRITARRGPSKALVAVEQTMLTAGELYKYARADYFTRHARPKPKPERSDSSNPWATRSSSSPCNRPDNGPPQGHPAGSSSHRDMVTRIFVSGDGVTVRHPAKPEGTRRILGRGSSLRWRIAR